MIIPVANSSAFPMGWRVAAWASYVFAIPFLTGIIIGALVQRNFLIWLFKTRVLRWTGIKPINHVPTAWDWKFGQTAEQFVLIALKDGTEFTGLLGPDSFISSNPGERDLYVQKLFERDDDGNWLETEKSLYVSKDEIRTVEFWPAIQDGRDGKE